MFTKLGKSNAGGENTMGTDKKEQKSMIYMGELLVDQYGWRETISKST